MCKRHARQNKAQFQYIQFAMTTIRESIKTKESEVSWCQFRDGHHSRKFAKINFDFFLNVSQDLFLNVSQDRTWPKGAPFDSSDSCDIRTQQILLVLQCLVDCRANKTYAACRHDMTFFIFCVCTCDWLWPSLVKTKESEVLRWQFHDSHHSWNFAKINFDFFLNAKQDPRKRSVMMAISRWSPFAKICKNEFWLF